MCLSVYPFSKYRAKRKTDELTNMGGKYSPKLAILKFIVTWRKSLKEHIYQISCNFVYPFSKYHTKNQTDEQTNRLGWKYTLLDKFFFSNFRHMEKITQRACLLSFVCFGSSVFEISCKKTNRQTDKQNGMKTWPLEWPRCSHRHPKRHQFTKKPKVCEPDRDIYPRTSLAMSQMRHWTKPNTLLQHWNKHN